MKKKLAKTEWNCIASQKRTPKVGDIWLNEKENQTKVLLAVSDATDTEPCFAAFQVLETGCVYNEYFEPSEHTYLGKSICDLDNLFEIAQ